MHNTNTTQLWPEAFQPTAQFPEVLQKGTSKNSSFHEPVRVCCLTA